MAGKKGKSGGKHKGDQGGRPSKLTKELGEQICELVAKGYTLRQIEGKLDISRETIITWVVQGEAKKEGFIWFSDLYARAREVQVEIWGDDLVDISDDGSNDWYQRESKDGSKSWIACDQENINRSRLRVDSRKWLMSKRMPKKYGEKLQHTGDEGGPIKVVLEWAKKSS